MIHTIKINDGSREGTRVWVEFDLMNERMTLQMNNRNGEFRVFFENPEQMKKVAEALLTEARNAEIYFERAE